MSSKNPPVGRFFSRLRAPFEKTLKNGHEEAQKCPFDHLKKAIRDYIITLI
jgi:hypothetical protein